MRLLSPFRASSTMALLAAIAVASSAPATAQKLVYTATLDGAQEVPPTGSAGTGSATVVIDRDKNTVNYRISFSGLGSAETLAHIHGFAPAGVNAPIVFNLPLGSLKIGTWTYAEADEANIIAGLTYVNIHSALIGSGEIRGQLVLDTTPTTGLYANIDAAQEVPPTPSSATGNAYFAIDTAANTLNYNISFSGLGSAETLAHIHGPAPVGSNAGILFNLPLGSPKIGTWNYPEMHEANILNGLMYVNIHSTNLGSGEIRGQILPVEITSAYCKGKVNSLSCTPSIGSTGTPSAAAGPDNFFVTCSNALNNKTGLIFWGTKPANSPLLGGTLCVGPPLTRAAAQSSGGTVPPANDCSGTYSFHLSEAYMAANGLDAGDIFYGEWWMRDPPHPDGLGVGFSNAIQVIIQP
jgi:hypothetical protein